MSDKQNCPTCNGHGTLMDKSFGLPTYGGDDNALDTPHEPTCPDCNGTGEAGDTPKLHEWRCGACGINWARYGSISTCPQCGGMPEKPQPNKEDPCPCCGRGMPPSPRNPYGKGVVEGESTTPSPSQTDKPPLNKVANIVYTIFYTEGEGHDKDWHIKQLIERLGDLIAAERAAVKAKLTEMRDEWAKWDGDVKTVKLDDVVHHFDSELEDAAYKPAEIIWGDKTLEEAEATGEITIHDLDEDAA